MPNETHAEERVPVVTGNHAPFRLVMRDGEDVWEPTLEQINRSTYDYVKLHRASTYIDVGIAPYSLVVCFDGTLALPAVEKFRDPERALGVFNQFLAEVFLGGVYCEAMSPDDICLGTMTYTAYCKSFRASRGVHSDFHSAIRTKHAGLGEVIRLLSPETITVSLLQAAVAKGRQRVAGMGSLATDTLLYGSTFLAHNQWAESLIHLWTTVEQIIEAVWSERVLSAPGVLGISQKKRSAFLKDHRTWPVSAKLETLYQKGLLPETTYARLDVARTARNAFAHTAVRPTRGDAEAALDGLCQLASLRLSNHTDASAFIDIFELVQSRSRAYTDWDRAGKPIEGVTHWLEIPPIPGDKNWGDQPYEVIEELQLRPLDTADPSGQ